MAKRPPQYVALKKADAAYGLPVGVTRAWLDSGLLDRVYFVDRGEIVVGVIVKQLLQRKAQARARAVERARAATVGATVR